MPTDTRLVCRNTKFPKKAIKAIKALKDNGWTVKKAGHRYSIDGRIKPVLLIQDKAFWGVTIDGNKRQLGRQLRQLAKRL